MPSCGVVGIRGQANPDGGSQRANAAGPPPFRDGLRSGDIRSAQPQISDMTNRRSYRRRSGCIAALGAALLLAGCGTAGEEQAPAGASGVPQVHWTTAYTGGAVRVTVDDPGAHYRVEKVTLYTPDGAATDAAEITRDSLSAAESPGGLRPSVGIGGGYSSHGGFGTGLGVGLTFPLGGTLDREPERRTTTAVIPVADPVAYRRDAAKSEIQATLTAASGETSYARFPAPLPPDASQPLPSNGEQAR